MVYCFSLVIISKDYEPDEVICHSSSKWIILTPEGPGKRAMFDYKTENYQKSSYNHLVLI